MLFGFAGRVSEPSSWAGSAAWVRASKALPFWILVSVGRSFWVQTASRALSLGVLAASSAGQTKEHLSASTRSAADAGGRAAAAKEL